MEAKDIQVGKVYWAKVSGLVQPVKITKEYTGHHKVRRFSTYRASWNAVNLNTGRSIHIRGAQRLRREVTARDMLAIINTKREPSNPVYGGKYGMVCD